MRLVQEGPANVSTDKTGGSYSERTSDFLPGLLEGSDDLFAAVTPEGRLAAFNGAFRRAFLDITGMPPKLDMALGHLTRDFPSVAGSMVGSCQRALLGEFLHLPIEFDQGNNQKRYFDATFSSVLDPAGNAVVVAIAMRDVTDKRVAEKKFHGVLEATPDAMLVVHKGVIEFANSQLERMFGYAAGALPGFSLEQLIPERLRERHMVQRIGYEQQPKTRPMGSGLDLWGLKADGSEFPVEISLSPFEVGGERFVIGAVRDATARRRAEEKLRKESFELRNRLVTLQRQQDAPSELEVYREGFEEAAAALIHYEPDGRIKRVNDYFCTLIGFRREELLQMTLSQLTHPSDVGVNTDLDLKLIAGALASYQVDKRLICKDKAIIWVRLAVSLKRNSDGQPDYLIGVAEDISERKRAEEALRLAQLRLTMTAEIAHVGYAEFDVQTGVTFLSAELKRQLGYEDSDLSNTFGEWSRRLHPEDSERATAAMQGVIDGPNRELTLEYRLRHKDGRYLWFIGRGIALEDFPGRANKVLFTQIDITLRKTTEQKLREQAEELRLALMVGRSGTFQWDIQTHEYRWYDAMYSLYGLEPNEFGGRDMDWLACLLPDDRATATASLEASLKSGEYVADFRIRRRNDGSIRWISARGRVLTDEDGVARRMVGINVDVTEARRVQAEIEFSKARVEAILNNLNEGVIVIDLSGQVLDANPAALKLLNYSTADQARCHVEAFSEIFDLCRIGGQALEPNEFPFSRVLREGESIQNEELIVHRKKDDVSLIVSFNGTLVRGVDDASSFGVLTLIDISDRKQAELALQESERRLSLALKASNTSVWVLDVATQQLVSAEESLFSMLGYEPDELTSLADWVARIHEDDRPRAIQMIEEIINGSRNNYHGFELRYQTKNAGWHWILCQAVAAARDEHGKATRLIGTHTDINSRKEAEDQTREASLHDPLTGLPNRAFLYEYGSHLLASAQRSHGKGALLFIDLDRFKPINDQYGHDVGDRLLQEVGKRLVSCIRQEDLVGRLGGDEFVILLAHLDGTPHRAGIVARHVVDTLSKPFHIDSLELSVSPSIGVSYFPEHAETVERLIHTADLAMYQVKQSGRANYQIFTPELDQRADAVFRLEKRLRGALKNDRLALHYQPVIDLKSRKLISVEALVRLADDGDECDGPATFIPIAESTGLIGALGDWVAFEACQQHVMWCEEGLSVPIAINVSPLQFRQRGFPERLGSIIAETKVDPAGLQLEVTETTVMESDDSAIDILNRIKALGVKIALDDFGTGYSSLSRLSHLPLDKLKVDQSFVRGIGNDAASRAVTETILALGRNLKLDVVGEGIESEDTLRYLEEHGCEQAQGFWFSRPLPAGDLLRWHRARRLH